jgi:hypothetical protein
MSPRKRLAIAAALLVVGACAPAAQQAAFNQASNPATVFVKNDNWNDVVVYLVRGNQRVRLGSVPSIGRAEFRLPQAYVLGVSDVTLQADPIGATESYISPPIQVYEGARVVLSIQKQLRLSSFAVYASD